MSQFPRNDPMSKFQLITQVPLPAYCVACRTMSNGQNQFVDLTMDIDYYGAVVLCSNCAVEMAGLFNLVDVAIIADNNEQLVRLEMDKIDLQKKVEVLERVVFTYGIAPDPVPSEPPTDLSGIEDEKSGEYVFEDSDSGFEKHESGSFK